MIQQYKTICYFILLIGIIVGLSIISSYIWGAKAEQEQAPGKLITAGEMTIGQFGQANGLPNSLLKEVFGLQDKSDLDRQLGEFGDSEKISSMVRAKRALASEQASKNWMKILAKFILWAVFLSSVFIYTGSRKLTPGVRKGLLLAAVLVFGVAMGSDPSPMGTVKDAIHLYGSARAVFPPRMIALGVFLAIVVLANKYICAWGCQVGVLQDLVFRINKSYGEKAAIGRRIKPPFVLTNSVRVAFFAVFTLAALAWGLDIINPIDPFKVFSPAHLGVAGGISAGILFLASLFVYRPWCHFFCPFGLTGWLAEKASVVKINVDYKSCVACGKCAEACPSTVMGAILKRNKKTIPDCFACYECRDACPTGAIRFSTGKRTMPPAGHFNGQKESVKRHVF